MAPRNLGIQTSHNNGIAGKGTGVVPVKSWGYIQWMAFSRNWGIFPRSARVSTTGMCSSTNKDNMSLGQHFREIREISKGTTMPRNIRGSCTHLRETPFLETSFRLASRKTSCYQRSQVCQTHTKQSCGNLESTRSY